VAAAERRVNDLTGQVTAIARDQERVRENMKALRGSREEREPLQRYTRELSTQEDRLAALQTQLSAAAVERAERQAELARLVEQLSFDIEVD
jgi:septation ring formation regulator EzrA